MIFNLSKNPIQFSIRNSPKGESGYALLLVLLLVSLFSITVMGLCRRSVEAANGFRKKDQEFKNRWAQRSIEYTLFRRIPDYLESQRLRAIEAETYSRKANAQFRSFRGEVSLNSNSYEVVFEIEDAKLSVNTLYQHGGVNGLESALRNLGITAELLLKPISRSSLPEKEWGYFVSDQRQAFIDYSQLSPSGFFQDPLNYQAGSLQQESTLYGDGKLSLQLASEKALEALFQLTLEGKIIKDALETLSLDPNAKLEEFLNHQSMPSESRWFLRSVIQNGASTASLLVKSSYGEREHFDFVVKEIHGVDLKVWDRRRFVK